jgi:hypothetical protein
MLSYTPILLYVLWRKKDAKKLKYAKDGLQIILRGIVFTHQYNCHKINLHIHYSHICTFTIIFALSIINTYA